MNKRRVSLLIGLGVLVVLLATAGSWLAWYVGGLAPTPAGPARWIRFFKRTPLQEALERLQEKGVVRNPAAMKIYFGAHRGSLHVPVGTFQVQPGESAQRLLEALREPVQQMVRMPETNWARRDAHLLERHEVTSAADYMKLVDDPPQELASEVSFPLPAHNLEGYLFPDTYDFPPLLGALGVVKMRLAAFDRKVYRPLGMPKDLTRLLIIASLIELEAGTDRDRNMIAGVIENRLKKGMPLQMDASLMYALGRWRTLHFSDYKNVKSPFNLYLHKGLPPAPICSPSLKSIAAAMHPAHHDYLFYVALPNGESIFSRTFEEHKHNIRLRMKALSVLKPKPPRVSPTKPVRSFKPHKP